MSPARPARRRARGVFGAACAALLAATAALAPRSAAAQDVGCDGGSDVEVRALDFTGNRSFSDADLANAVVTTASDWAWRHLHFFGTKRCLDPVELPRDVVRLLIFYRNHGYFDAAVDTAVTRAGRSAVHVTFRIKEGKPVVIQSFRITGLDSLPEPGRLTGDLPVGPGETFDRYLIEAARDTILRRLRNTGYPAADVLKNDSIDYARRTAVVDLAAIPGRRSHIGRVQVVVEPLDAEDGQQISDKTVRRLLGVEPGDLYRERDLVDAQRRLYQTEAYRHVDVKLGSDTGSAAGDSLVDVEVRVAEAYMHGSRVGAGWGNLDCLRAQGTYTDRNFLKGARRLELTGRVSKIGIGQPLDFDRLTNSLCQAAKPDPFSGRLNYYAGASFRQPYIFGLRSVPTFTLYTSRVSEYKVYLRTIGIGGVASFTRQGSPRLPMTFAYQTERGRTESQPAYFCAVFNICASEERERAQRTQQLAVASWVVTRDRSDNLLSPTRGTVAQIQLRGASRWILSDTALQFTSGVGTASWYLPGGGRNVIAARLRIGGVFGIGTAVAGAQRFVPPQERLYAGGPTTVRGFRQNELGPSAYVVREATATEQADGTLLYEAGDTTQSRVVPLGGNTLFIANFEYRFPSFFWPELLQYTLFVDGGDVWNRPSTRAVNFNSFKWTPGAGLRVISPVGPIRVDVGYNPYARPLGPAYFVAPEQERAGGGLVAPLYCVSPGNRLPVRQTDVDQSGQPIYEQDPGVCESSFKPQRETGLLNRLTFNFSIGQAF